MVPGFEIQDCNETETGQNKKKLLFIEIKQKFSFSAMNFRLINDTVLRVIMQAYHRKVNLIAFHCI